MKLALLSAGSSVHTIRWANGLVGRDIEVVLISAHDPLEILDKRVIFEKLPVAAPLGYFINVGSLKRILERHRPDILNVHYASGYGSLARLTDFHPYLLSVWGSDVYDFPRKSIFHRQLVARNIRAADAIASTSRCMLKVTNSLYKHSETHITPFGIDPMLFTPESKAPSGEFVFGTVKVLAEKYGIDTLIDAFAILQRKYPQRNLALEITGSGPDQKVLEALAADRCVSGSVRFLGRVNHSEVPDRLHRLDVYVALSRLDSESFGVAILEASSCGLPVVVSDVEGLMEVTEHEQTGLIVTRESPEAAALAMETLMLDRELRRRLGQNGREHVVRQYTWESSLDSMLHAYESTIAGYAR